MIAIIALLLTVLLLLLVIAALVALWSILTGPQRWLRTCDQIERIRNASFANGDFWLGTFALALVTPPWFILDLYLLQ